MNMRIPLALTILVASIILTSSCYSKTRFPDANTPVIFRADFEDNTLDNWNYLLNPQGIDIVDRASAEHPIYSGEKAAKITIQGSDDFLWNGKAFLNRSELQYAPSSVTEGGNTYISFAFMLPALFTEDRHEFAYWESNKSYQQIMRFNLSANTLFFQMSDGEALWSFNKIAPGVWYKVDMHIRWSSAEHSNSTSGAVKVWLDDKIVLDETRVKTLIADEQAFFQIGILRDQQALAETIYLDDIIEYQVE